MGELFNKSPLWSIRVSNGTPANRVWIWRHTGTPPLGYLPTLIGMLDQVRAGTAKPYDVEWVGKMIEDARAIPTRDIASLTAGWQGEHEGQWTDNGWQEGRKDWWSRLDPLSPDVGPIALQIKDKLDRGTATDQEKALFEGVMSMGADWNTRASVPQASDAFNPLGDQLFGALGTIALGATGGLAGGALAAGGGLASTIGSLGTLSGIAGTGASVLGQATDQPWLSKAGQVLGAVGGLAGGASGLANLWGTGINSLSDAARLASSAGKVTGALGAATGVPGLQQAGSYLGLAGNLGQAGSELSAGNLGAGVPRLLSVLGQGRGIAQRLAGGQEEAPGRPQGQRPDLVRGPAPTSPPLQAPMPAPMMPPGRSGPQPDGIQRLLAAAQMAQRGAPLPDWRSILMRGAQ